MGMRIKRPTRDDSRKIVPSGLNLDSLSITATRLAAGGYEMSFADLDALTRFFRSVGVTRLVCKALAENDNSKQQIYLGGSFEVLQLLPHRSIRTESLGKRPNFKAALDFSWIDDAGQTAIAHHAQLILYPDYPEVRLSGFLLGCPVAPSKAMQPVPKDERKHFNDSDGRVLFFGVTADDKIFAYLAKAGSLISIEFAARLGAGAFRQDGVFLHVPLGGAIDTRAELLSKLREIHHAGWHVSKRLDRDGRIIAYQAQNGGGFTLEALLGVRPNAKAAPDYLGWEIKAYGSGKVTLMTPEPDSGYYGTHGVKAFVRKYGHDAGNDVLYFTGIHRVNEPCAKSGQILRLRGFDHLKRKIVDVGGGIELVDNRGEVSAAWTFEGLIDHWSRKHAAAAYVPYEKKAGAPPEYQYTSPVLLGEETEFPLYLAALHSGKVFYDPASKVMRASTANSSVKARSQFRMTIANLALLYKKFEAIEL